MIWKQSVPLSVRFMPTTTDTATSGMTRQLTTSQQNFPAEIYLASTGIWCIFVMRNKFKSWPQSWKYVDALQNKSGNFNYNTNGRSSNNQSGAYFLLIRDSLYIFTFVILYSSCSGLSINGSLTCVSRQHYFWNLIQAVLENSVPIQKMLSILSHSKARKRSNPFDKEFHASNFIVLLLQRLACLLWRAPTWQKQIIFNNRPSRRWLMHGSVSSKRMQRLLIRHYLVPGSTPRHNRSRIWPRIYRGRITIQTATPTVSLQVIR